VNNRSGRLRQSLEKQACCNLVFGRVISQPPAVPQSSGGDIRKTHIRRSATKLRISTVLFSFQLAACLSAADLPTAPPDELIHIYQQLRSLQGSDQGAVAENVEWKRDAATFTFIDGRLTFAQPVAGHVLAAVFDRRGRIQLKPPTETEQHQLARFTKAPELADEFKQAVFFFTDDSWSQLQQLVRAV